MNDWERLVLMIFDGWGIRKETDFNAVAMARTPHYARLLSEYPWTVLDASGLSVGLPDGIMGNSEVGHTNIGAGRRVLQDQVRIHRAIDSGEFFSNPALKSAISRCGRGARKLHLLGLVSQGDVHSAERHYLELIAFARREGVPADRVFVHAVLDGRDTPPRSAAGYLANLEGRLEREGGRIATIAGRYYTMDRDRRWERTDKGYRALVHGRGEKASSAEEALRAAYGRNESDEFVLPTVIVGPGGAPLATVGEGDSVICFNFRADRMRQIVRALTAAGAPVPSLKPGLALHVVSMTQYDKTFAIPSAFPPIEISMCLGQAVSRDGRSQFRAAETEKYAHVTYFLNGGREEPFDREDRLLVPSPKVATYDLQPAMSSEAVTASVLERIGRGKDALIVVNFAQPDMVGHTGIFDAAVQAVEAGDRSIGLLSEACLDHRYNLLITSDHGNVEMMRDPATGEPHTAHTTNPVPVVCVGPRFKRRGIRGGGALCDVAPTVLEILGIPKPREMDGTSLL